MIIDSNNFPRDTGATDFMDSARLIGLMKLINFKLNSGETEEPKCSAYVLPNGLAVRYPGIDANNVASSNPLNVTRDQLIPLAAGLYVENETSSVLNLLKIATKGKLIARAQNTEADVIGSTKPWYNGADILSPADTNHLRLCAGLKGTWFGYLWLKLEIAIHNKYTPNREPNQILCKAVIAGSKYVKQLRSNPNLIKAIYTYWAVDRGEYYFADEIINFLDKYDLPFKL